MKIFTYNDFGTALRKALELMDTNQVQFAKKMGVSRSQLAHWVNNIVTPRKDKVDLINRTLKKELLIDKTETGWNLIENETDLSNTFMTMGEVASGSDSYFEKIYKSQQAKIENHLSKAIHEINQALDVCYMQIQGEDMTNAMGLITPEKLVRRYYTNLRAAHDLLSLGLKDLSGKEAFPQHYDYQPKIKIKWGYESDSE